mgnify:FL=1
MIPFTENAKLIHGIELEYSFPRNSNKTYMDVKQKLESLGVFYTHNERDGTPTDRENC